MPNPCNATVTFDGQKFNALSANFEVATMHDNTGMPSMGTTACAIGVVVDVHDDVNIPFSVLNNMFEHSHTMTKDKIKEIKIEFWKDESKKNAVCTFSFRGWISRFALMGGGGDNHMLSLSLQPELGSQQFVKFAVGN
jgi:hypothetical protein